MAGEGKSLGIKELDDLLIHFFEHDNDKSFVIISKSILHSFYVTAEKGRNKYAYFYIKEDIEYDEICPYIWLSKEHCDLLSGDNGGLGIPVQEVIESSRLGHISIDPYN